MIRKHIPRSFVIFIGTLPLAGVLFAQLPRTRLNHPQTMQVQTPPQGDNDANLKFFTGKIYNNNGKYVLDGASPRGPYLLDDQKRARQYEGKHVRVIGVLEVTNNTIHVRNIEEASG